MTATFNDILIAAEQGQGWLADPSPMTATTAAATQYVDGILAELDRAYAWSGWGVRAGVGPDPARVDQFLAAWLGPYPSQNDRRDPDDPNDPPLRAQRDWEAATIAPLLRAAMALMVTQINHAPPTTATYAPTYGPRYGRGKPDWEWSQEHWQLVSGWWDGEASTDLPHFLAWLRGTKAAAVGSPLAGQLDLLATPAEILAAVQAAAQTLTAPDRVPLTPAQLKHLLMDDYPSVQPADLWQLSVEQWQVLSPPVQGFLDKKLQYLSSRYDRDHADRYNFFGTPWGLLWTALATTLTAGAVWQLVGPALGSAMGLTAPVEVAAPAVAAAVPAVTPEVLVPFVAQTVISSGLKLAVREILDEARPDPPTVTPRPVLPPAPVSAAAPPPAPLAAAVAADGAAPAHAVPVQALPGQTEGEQLPGEAAGMGPPALLRSPTGRTALGVVLLGVVAVAAAKGVRHG